MKKGSKIGLGIFLGIIGVIVTAVVVVCVMLFSVPAFSGPKYSEAEMQSAKQKLPVFDKLEVLRSGDSSIDFSSVALGAAEHASVELSQGEINAILSLNIVNVDKALSGKLACASPIKASYNVPIAGISAEVKEDSLKLLIKLGNCNSLTGNTTVDNYITGAIVTAEFKNNQEGGIKLHTVKVNNLDAGMAPDFIISSLPGYDGGGIVNYANNRYGDVVQALFEQIFLAQNIETLHISQGRVIIEGYFYQSVGIGS